MSMNNTICITDLSIGYPGRKGVHIVASGLNGTISSGELTCLLGVNGIGKSTLLRTLSAFQPKLGGSIEICGHAIECYTARQMSTLISVVLTDKPDIRNMTVEELVGLGRSPYTGFWGTLDVEDKSIVKSSLQLVNIVGLSHRMVERLSDGERQKVMIAKALAQSTPTIFLDEPTAFLDYPSKIEMLCLLRKLAHDTGKTIFLSIHDWDLALKYSDKIWFMERGKDIAVSRPDAIDIGTLLSLAGRRAEEE